MSKPVIEVKNLSKRYRIRHQKGQFTLRDKPSDSFKRPLDIVGKKSFFSSKEDLWALKEVSFDIEKGEVVGLIGRNGAGKTTLLKILSRITYPTEGEIRLRGKVGSLLELGTGFNLELTGRENIYFNGAILGMRKKEIDTKFDEIVEFSGVEKFLDTPVKRFSSGMKTRLAFSVAAHLEPEILLIDEVLAVGDVEFQKKCLGKMQSVSEAGRTIVFISHDMSSIIKLCKRTILIDGGRKILDGESEKVVSYYLDKNLHEGAKVSEKELEAKIEGINKKGDPTICLKEVSIINQHGLLCNSFKSNEDIVVSVFYECLSIVKDLHITVQVVNEENKPILITQNADNADEIALYKRKPGMYRSFVTIPANTFGDNRLYLTLHLDHPTADYLIANKILGFDVEFQGYNNTQHTKFGKTFMRPKFSWKTEFVNTEKPS